MHLKISSAKWRHGEMGLCYGFSTENKQKSQKKEIVDPTALWPSATPQAVILTAQGTTGDDSAIKPTFTFPMNDQVFNINS